MKKMMSVIATGDRHGGKGRGIVEVTTMIDQGHRGRKLRNSTYLHGRDLRGKMALTMNVTSASADPDTEAWMSWLACAFVVHPEQISGGERFAMMDIKLALALQMMLRSAPDDAKDVVHDIQLHAERRQSENRLIKGREIIAIILQSFRSSDRSDMVFRIQHQQMV